MANYPLKINIQTKNGTQFTYYRSSFSTDADTAVSASTMVTKVNALLAAQYTASSEAPAAYLGAGGFSANVYL